MERHNQSTMTVLWSLTHGHHRVLSWLFAGRHDRTGGQRGQASVGGARRAESAASTDTAAAAASQHVEQVSHAATSAGSTCSTHSPWVATQGNAADAQALSTPARNTGSLPPTHPTDTQPHVQALTPTHTPSSRPHPPTLTPTHTPVDLTSPPGPHTRA